MVKRFAVVLGLVALGACGDKGGDDGGASEPAYAVFYSSDLTAAAAMSRIERYSLAKFAQPKLLAALTLDNLSGQADSLLVNTTEDGCGFTAWAANSQSGAVAQEGRTYEDFDLGNPENWTSTGRKLRDGCSGGTVFEVEAYFKHADFKFTGLTITGGVTEATVRIAMGTVGDYQAGDILVKDTDETFKWVDGSSLVTTRPAAPLQMDGIKDFEPFLDGGASTNTVLQAIKIDPDTESETQQVTSSSTKSVIDVDLSNHGITGDSSAASLAAFAASLDIPFVKNVRGGISGLSASVKILTDAEIGGSTDPQPELGNPPAM